MCIFFIFFVLLEFAFVFNCLRTGQKPKAEYVEKIMVYVIPCLFLVFNVIYWTCVLSAGTPAE
jgi:hypothetical protein